MHSHDPFQPPKADACGCGHDHSHDHDCQCAAGAHRPSCFDAALEVASECEDCRVVHAWLHLHGKWVLHAWGETDEAVYDLTETRNPQPRADYYARNGVTEERLRRYGRVEFFTIMADTGSFGPFDTAFFFAPES
ncbi:MAG TPA: hypothetical protein DEV75_12720, partial [Desulfovibrio sp.]|nr:hypothetical protein [Desulfovibrio sp.]